MEINKSDITKTTCCGKQMEAQWFMDGPTLVCAGECKGIWLWPLGYDLTEYKKIPGVERYGAGAWAPNKMDVEEKLNAG
jgi:hypothetical protein